MYYTKKQRDEIVASSALRDMVSRECQTKLALDCNELDAENAKLRHDLERAIVSGHAAGESAGYAYQAVDSLKMDIAQLRDRADTAETFLRDIGNATGMVWPEVVIWNEDLLRALLEHSKIAFGWGRGLCEELRNTTTALLNLLAVVHRDGGQHTARVGAEQSAKDAQATCVSLLAAKENAELYAKERDLERLRCEGVVAELSTLRGSIGKLQDIACAASDIVFGGELAWDSMSTKDFTQAMRSAWHKLRTERDSAPAAKENTATISSRAEHIRTLVNERILSCQPVEAERDAAITRAEQAEARCKELEEDAYTVALAITTERHKDEVKAITTRAERAERSERDLRCEIEAAFRKHGLAAGPGAVDALVEQRNAAVAERDHWKANHDNQVAIKAALLDRPDLQDRARSMVKLKVERDAARHEKNEAIAERDRLREALAEEKQESLRQHRLAEGFRTDYAASNRERDRLREELADKEARRYAATHERDAAIAERDQLKEKLNRANIDLSAEMKKLDEAIAERDRLRDELAHNVECCHERNQFLRERDAALARAEKMEHNYSEIMMAIADQLGLETGKDSFAHIGEGIAKLQIERDALAARVKELESVNRSFFPEINDLKHRLGVETALREQAWSVIKRIGGKAGWVDHPNDAPWQERIVDRVKAAIAERDELRAQIAAINALPALLAIAEAAEAVYPEADLVVFDRLSHALSLLPNPSDQRAGASPAPSESRC